jgi:hypothetical protein
MTMNEIDTHSPQPDAGPPDAGPSEEEAVASLIRNAGPRPAAPADITTEVKAAARARWQEVVQARQRRRFYWRSAAVLAAAAALVLVLSPRLWRAPGPTAPVLAQLESVQGPVQILDADETGLPREASKDSEITSGATVITTAGPTGSASRAVLRLAQGTAPSATVRLDTGTRLRLEGPGELYLEQGAVYLDTGFKPTDTALAVHTAWGTVHDIGTRFEVRLGDGRRDSPTGLSVRVRDGVVVLRDAGTEHHAGAGEELMVHSDGTITERAIPTTGEAWSWIETLLPAFDTEGRSLHELLIWAARESGRELRFADPSLAVTAQNVELHGSIEGLSLDEAVELSLLSSGLPLEAHQQDGELVVVSGTPE